MLDLGVNNVDISMRLLEHVATSMRESYVLTWIMLDQK